MKIFRVIGILQLTVNGLMIVTIIIWNDIVKSAPTLNEPIIGNYTYMGIQYYIVYSRMNDFFILSLLSSFYFFIRKEVKIGFLLLVFSLIGLITHFVYREIFYIA